MTDPDLFDPNDHNVADVLDYLTENPEDTDRVLAAEQAGKARVSILGPTGRPEDSPLADDRPDLDEFDRERVADVVYNPDGEWLAPVDRHGRMLVTETGDALV